MDQIQKERREKIRREEDRGDNEESIEEDLPRQKSTRELDHSEKEKLQSIKISKLQEANRKLQEEKKNLLTTIEVMEGQQDLHRYVSNFDKEESEMLGREIALEYAKEKDKRENAMAFLRVFFTDGIGSFDKWVTQWLEQVKPMVDEYQTEVNAEQEQWKSALDGGVTAYQLRVRKWEDGKSYTVFEEINPSGVRENKFYENKDVDAAEAYQHLVGIAEWKYHEMAEKRKMDWQLMEARNTKAIRGMQEDLLRRSREREEVKRVEKEAGLEDRTMEKIPDETDEEIKETEDGTNVLEEDEPEIPVHYSPERDAEGRAVIWDD